MLTLKRNQNIGSSHLSSITNCWRNDHKKVNNHEPRTSLTNLDKNKSIFNSYLNKYRIIRRLFSLHIETRLCGTPLRDKLHKTDVPRLTNVFIWQKTIIHRIRCNLKSAWVKYVGNDTCKWNEDSIEFLKC